ncbi:hypothetical protein HK098_003177 [Nowakowskiella sp. JEL0407]|nr:hypothetical protein HK098_003177 [Nowakowskiella sp. JEL0407]
MIKETVAMIRITAFVAFALFIASINAIPLFPRGLDISANPFDGAIWHIDLEWTQKVKSATYTNSVIEGKANTVMKQSTAIWIDKIANLPRVTLNMQNARNRANAMGKPVVVQFVVYDLPGRDCHALSSNGELSAGQDAEYQGYINDFAQRLKDNAADNVRVVLIIEPDSLPNIATNLANPKCKAAESSYRKGVAYALAKLSLPNVWMYIDVAHGGWLGWESGQTAAIPVFKSVISDAMAIQPSLRIAGWATNTANYSPLNYNGVAPAKQHILELKNGRLVYDFNPCIDELTFIGDLKKNFSVNNLPTRFIIDTSRNGVPGIRTDWGNWCNVKGSGIGSLPTVNPVANVDAYVWVKPPGESDGQSSGGDGYCDPTNTQHGMDALANAPRAGEWFQDMFVQLIQNANPPLVDSGLIKINWKPDLWAFACDWTGGDLSNARTSGADCGPLCGRTSGCTHFTWNSYNGGTCWMKTGSVLPEDAKSTGDQSMVCGYTNTINWNGDWAFGCDWKGNDLSNKLSSGDLCGGICNNTPDCTHFTWSAYNGGTCWLKKNYSITKANAFRTTDGTVVCGINSLRVNQEAKTQKRKQVAAQFVPQFRFHPNEDIWPTNLDEFMSHAVSVVTISSDSTKLNIIQSNPQPATLNPLLGITETAEVNFSDNYSDVTVNYFTSWVHTKLSTDLWKVYTIIYDKDFDEKDAAVDWYEIQYWLLYPYNSVPGGPNDSDWSLLKPIAGTYDHIADLECVTLRFDKKTNLPTRIWLSQHGNGPVYKWDTPSNNGYVPFAKDGAGHPIVYVSQGTHSHRGFVGDFNFKVIKYWDHTSDSGLHWTPSASNLDITFVNEPFDKIDRTKFYQANDRNRWLVFNGDFGYIKITSSIFTSAKFSRVSHVTSIFQQGGQGSFTEKLNDEETHCDNDWDHSFFHSAGACSMPV